MREAGDARCTRRLQSDYSAVQTIRETRLVHALGKFDQRRNEAIDRVFKLSGRWWRGVDGTRIEVVQPAIDQALYLFERA
jgi:hypothetical protein